MIPAARRRATRKRVVGVALSDELDNLGAFTVTSSGSGINISGGQAQWAGTTDGKGTALYNTSPMTTNRYASIEVGSPVSSSRYSGVILCTDASRSRMYGVSFSNSTVWFKDVTGSGDWFGTATDLTSASASISAGTLIEVWNIGTLGYVAVNGATVISGLALNSTKLAAGYNRQGFGIYRSGYANSSPIRRWCGGDAAAAYGKS